MEDPKIDYDDENNISTVYYTLSSLKENAIQYVVEGPIERVSQIHDYLKDKFSYIGNESVEQVKGMVESGKQTMQDALGLLAATFGIYYPNNDSESPLSEEQSKVTLEKIKDVVDKKLRLVYHSYTPFFREKIPSCSTKVRRERDGIRIEI